MRATLEFNLEDFDEIRMHRHAINGMSYFFALNGILEELRRRIKSDVGDSETTRSIQEWIINDLEERAIHLDDI